jgi:DNA-binding response OmpR family regulator
VRLLFAESGQFSKSTVGRVLSNAGYAVDVVGTRQDAEEAVLLASYNLAILDQHLPDGDGLALLRSLRRNGNTIPIVLLTARHSTEALIQCLDAGADDYLVRPFDMGEFLARVRAVLRRPRDEFHLVLKGGNLSFDTSSREIKIDDQPLILSRGETLLVEALLRRLGRVVTRESMESILFEREREVTPNAIEASVSRLRKRLTANRATLDIQTIRGIGYSLRCVHS